jgi:hypothetical protein
MSNSAEVHWGDEYSFKLTEGKSPVQSLRMFGHLLDTGAYRMNIDLGIVAKVRKWLFWNVALSDRHSSNPVLGRSTNDSRYMTGLSRAFGR